MDAQTTADIGVLVAKFVTTAFVTYSTSLDVNRLGHLGLELEERIDTDRAANARLPQLLTVSMWHSVSGKVSDWRGGGTASRSCPLRKPRASTIADDALGLVCRLWSVTHVHCRSLELSQ